VRFDSYPEYAVIGTWMVSTILCACTGSVAPLDATAPDVQALDGGASDRAPVDVPAALHACTGIAEFDTGSLAIAEQSCGHSARCRTCVQGVDASGRPTSYVVYIEDMDCFCGRTVAGGPLLPMTCATSTTFTIPTREDADSQCADERDCIVCSESINRSVTRIDGLLCVGVRAARARRRT